jgi:hypothetical protein
MTTNKNNKKNNPQKQTHRPLEETKETSQKVDEALETKSDTGSSEEKAIEIADEVNTAESNDLLVRAKEIENQFKQLDSAKIRSGELMKEFEKVAQTLVEENARLEAVKASLVAREHAVVLAEQSRDVELAEARKALEGELGERRATLLDQIEKELSSLRSVRLADIEKAEAEERERSRQIIEREKESWAEDFERQGRIIQNMREEVEREKGIVLALQNELEGRRVELQQLESDIEERNERLKRMAQRRSGNLDAEVRELLDAERRTFQVRLESAAADADHLREALRSQDELLGNFEQLQRQLGGREPAAVIAELKTLNEQLVRAREELATRPSEEMRTRNSFLEDERTNLRNTIDTLTRDAMKMRSDADKAAELMRVNGQLSDNLSLMEQRADLFEGASNQYKAELDRLRSAYERPAEIEARFSEIELPLVGFDRIIKGEQSGSDENEWLSGVQDACSKYGIHFHPRIIKAFHTSLKTSEWSPLTILAGVSGTGKSELPRLYSHFGGLYFEPLSVQPTWDSQESMLGFFNSIDNKFDAQPVLRFLAQSQKERKLGATLEDKPYPGLSDSLCLVLLDEMNLAHPELYFAEFLSKLELRRGMKGAEVPKLPVKIGAGMKQYELPLGRNVLWIGTMNQDETTKSLSDKVLDRAVVIYFPRPSDLKRRQRLTPLDDGNRGSRLPLSTWRSWLAQESLFTEEEVLPYKRFVEEMNQSLSVAGRAIGHRVWQSIEYYMSNYPDVREAGGDMSAKKLAMHIAFEDQLVQKVMPKLRGIDTRGKSLDECLAPIRAQLIAGVDGHGFELAEDFDLATELGYGQFMWQTANYLKDDVVNESA